MKELIFRLTAEEANLIGRALGELPYKIAAPLIQKMRQQAAEQLAAEEQKAQEPEKSGA